MSNTYSVGDRVKFVGIDVNAADRKTQDIDGTQGEWPNLTAGAVGTVNDVVPSDEGGDPNNARLFVVFDGIPCATDSMAFLLGMPAGWPVLASEVERAEVAA